MLAPLLTSMRQPCVFCLVVKAIRNPIIKAYTLPSMQLTYNKTIKFIKKTHSMNRCADAVDEDIQRRLLDFGLWYYLAVGRSCKYLF